MSTLITQLKPRTTPEEVSAFWLKGGYPELQPLVHFIADHKCPFGIVINNDIRAQPYTETIYGIPFASL